MASITQQHTKKARKKRAFQKGYFPSFIKEQAWEQKYFPFPAYTYESFPDMIAGVTNLSVQPFRAHVLPPKGSSFSCAVIVFLHQNTRPNYTPKHIATQHG
jgi:hypothetical protein